MINLVSFNKPRECVNNVRSNESSEDYLETILILGNRSSLVRAVDIAAEMGFKKPSVSVAMKNLRQKNLITVADNGDIRLTEDGHKIADKVYERHQLISSWLMILGVQEKQRFMMPAGSST